MSNQICEMTIAEVAPLLENRKISPIELLDATLARIAKMNPRLNAFWTLTEEQARKQARAAEAEIAAGKYRGPLHGVPVALKDLYYTRGVRTTAGSIIMKDFVPDFDATVVEKLRDAGAVSLGKTALHEFAYGVTNDNPHFGPTRNPWNTDRTPGGSSGGSGAAVACGMAFAGMGSDTGGSIRIPASFCGVAGLKPTFGRVSVHGIYPLGYTLDHAGPLARTAEDVAIVYDAIAGYDPKDNFCCDVPVREVRFKKRLNRMRIGVTKDYFSDHLHADVERAFGDALKVFESLGARIVPVELPDIFDLTEAGRITLLSEAYVLHKQHLEEHPDQLGKDVKMLIERGKEPTAADYVNAQLVRYKFRRRLEEMFHQVDVLVTPTTPLTAFPLGTTKVTLAGREEDARTAGTRLTRPFNATGHPVLAVPCGFDGEGLPIGMQIVGKFWDEAAVLQAGYAYEQVTEWHKKRPPIGA